MRDDSGLAGIALILIIGWALAAVFLLTQILIAAQQIDERVQFITTQVSPIDKDLDAINLAVRTNQLVDQILVEAEPLSPLAGQILGEVGSINRSVTSIHNTVGSINSNVQSIGSSVGSIHQSVLSIDATVDAIHGNATRILSEVRSIDGRGLNIGAQGTGGVEGINRRVDIVIGLVRGIKSDTGNVLAQVGRGNPAGHGVPGAATIHGHANSIDCNTSALNVVQGRGAYCGR